MLIQQTGAGDVAIDKATGNPVCRTTPEHRVKRVYANTGMVVVVGEVGGQDVEQSMTRSQAIERARAIQEMIPITPYADERRSLQNMVEQFMDAILKAKEQSGGKYKSVNVSMYVAGKTPAGE